MACVAGPAPAAATMPRSGSCVTQSAGLQLNVRTVRSIGISPLLVFFDATATTDPAVTNSVAQDVTFTWFFGDGGASGSGTWAHGSNPLHNSMNVASGIVAAHLYRVASHDTDYTATVTATDGTNTAICSLDVTAYDPNGPNGFPGASTTCVSASTRPVPGSGGCPSGAKVLKEPNIPYVLESAYGNGKRILFKCGDTFSGDNGAKDNLTAVKWAIGAYGGCEDTQNNRPVMSNSSQNYIFEFSNRNGNGTISDLDCEGNGSQYGGCIWGNDDTGVMYQVTMYNLYANNEQVNFAWNQCSQCGLVQVYQNNVVGPQREIGTYINIAAFSHFPLSGNSFNDIAYQAVIGSYFDDGTANYKDNSETVRISSCQECYIANSDFLNAGPAYAQLKLHGGGKGTAWMGEYTQYMEISDNYFGGTSGANAVEMAPQSDEDDERLRYIVVERNLFDGVAKSGRQLMISGTNITARNNVFFLQQETAFGIQICERAFEPAPRTIEVFNNSFYARSGSYSAAAISISSRGCGGHADASNSYFQNNLGYFPNNRGGSIPMVSTDGTGTGNLIGNNTIDTARNPAWTNASATMKRITDWKPTAFYLGGAKVPVPFDALGAPWSVARDLGAVQH